MRLKFSNDRVLWNFILPCSHLPFPYPAGTLNISSLPCTAAVKTSSLAVTGGGRGAEGPQKPHLQELAQSDLASSTLEKSQSQDLSSSAWTQSLSVRKDLVPGHLLKKKKFSWWPRVAIPMGWGWWKRLAKKLKTSKKDHLRNELFTGPLKNYDIFLGTEKNMFL